MATIHKLIDELIQHLECLGPDTQTKPTYNEGTNMNTAYRTNANEITPFKESAWVKFKDQTKGIVKRTVIPAIIVGVIAIPIGVVSAARLMIRYQNLEAQENAQAVHFTDWEKALDKRQKDQETHWNDWEKSLNQRQNTIDENEKHSLANDGIRFHVIRSGTNTCLITITNGLTSTNCMADK